jgi:hypothetical protein
VAFTATRPKSPARSEFNQSIKVAISWPRAQRPGLAAKTVLFGDTKKYLIRRVRDLRVLQLVERFADYGQVAFIGFARYDGNLLDAGTHPVKYLVQHS